MIVFLTTVLILLCIIVVLLIMIQRTSGGMGSALGGGAADQVLGAGSAAQLTKFTVYGIVGFFIMAFVLYGFYQNESADADSLIRTGMETPVLQTAPDPSGPSVSDVPVPPPVPNASELPIPPSPPVEVPPAPPAAESSPPETKQEKASAGKESN